MKKPLNLATGNEKGSSTLDVPMYLSPLRERSLILAEVSILRYFTVEAQALVRMHPTKWTSVYHQNPATTGLYLLVNFSGTQFTLGISYYFGAGNWSIIECDYDDALRNGSQLPVMNYEPEHTYWKGLSVDPDTIELG